MLVSLMLADIHEIIRIAKTAGEAFMEYYYPRFNPTWEWDTAAGQCIVESAGGTVVDKSGSPLTYNKPSLKNENFIALGLVENMSELFNRQQSDILS